MDPLTIENKPVPLKVLVKELRRGYDEGEIVYEVLAREIRWRLFPNKPELPRWPFYKILMGGDNYTDTGVLTEYKDIGQRIDVTWRPPTWIVDLDRSRPLKFPMLVDRLPSYDDYLQEVSNLVIETDTSNNFRPTLEDYSKVARDMKIRGRAGKNDLQLKELIKWAKINRYHRENPITEKLRDYSYIMKPDLIKYMIDRGINITKPRLLRINDLVKINEDADKKELAAKKGVSVEHLGAHSMESIGSPN